jgi:hypothetical protein
MVNHGLAGIVAGELAYDRLPDYDVYSAASWAAEDTIKRVEPTAGVRVDPDEHV